MTSSQQFCLRWNNHPTNLLTVFEHLLQTEAFVDVTLAVEGIAVKAHKMVLSACSPYFESLFMGNPDKHPIVFLKDVKYSEIKALLDFMYRGEVSVDQENLTCLLKVAESLRIKGLTEVREKKVGDSTKLSPILPLNTSNCNSEPPMKRVALSTSPTPLNPLVGAQKRKRGRPRTLSPSPRSLSSPGPDSAVNNIDNVSAVNSTSHESESLEEMEHVEGCVEPDEIESNQRNNYEYREDDSHGSSSPLQDDDEKWSGKESESFGKENDEVHIKVEPESPLESSQSDGVVASDLAPFISIRIHSKSRRSGNISGPPFPCPECSKEFGDYKAMARHRDRTHPQVTRPCPECGATFKRTDHLSRHVKSVHGYTCSFCLSSFVGRGIFCQHLLSCHNTTWEMYQELSEAKLALSKK